jgi:bacillithiol synthase
MRFTQLPNTSGSLSQLYLDYLYDFDRVTEFFELDYRREEAYEEYAAHVCRNFKNRAQLVSVLLEQNQDIGASEQTLEHIRWLGKENGVAIVTGQQVGILGGPLYTLYKAISALKLAAHLNATIPAYKFVPVFWLEGEDHDFEEVNSIQVLNHDHLPAAIDYLPDGKPLERNIGAVGNHIFGNGVDTFFEKLRESLPASEFTPSVIDLFRAYYASGSTMLGSFARLMNRLFEGRGLVFINSNDRSLKRLLIPIFKKELNEVPRVSQLIIGQSAGLEERYHAQIKPKAVNLFLFHKEGRYLIEPREKDFSLKGTRQYFQKEELLRMADETPEVFSPNVALRPVCQDTLLPTLAYVSGPGEIAYFAQLRPVYEHFNVPMPIIYPRASATIAENRHQKTMEKYDLSIEDLFQPPEKLEKKIVDIVSEVDVDEMFADAQKRFSDIANEMKFGLNYIDPTLLGALESTKSKVEQALQVLKEKASSAQKQRHEIALRQLQRITNSIHPGNNLQERELNVATFMNKYGLELINRLYADLEIGSTEHQIIWLG